MINFNLFIAKVDTLINEADLIKGLLNQAQRKAQVEQLQSMAQQTLKEGDLLKDWLFKSICCTTPSTK